MATLASVWMNSGGVGWEKRSRMDLSFVGVGVGVGVGFSERVVEVLGEATNSKSYDSSVDILYDCDVFAVVVVKNRRLQ